MPRKSRRRKRSALNRVAPTIVTPFVGLGDVLSIIDFETWAPSGLRSRFRGLLYAVFAALAACARIRPPNATHFLLADYEADRLRAPNPDRRFYPVILLPVAVAAIEAYLAHRRELGIGGIHLLVDEDGKKLKYRAIYDAFFDFSQRRGHVGGKVIERLIEFHDLQLEKETRDAAACVALRRGRRGNLDKGHAQADIDAAAADRARLARVLARNHALAGAAGRSIGGHGRAKAREQAKMYMPTTRVYRLSPAVWTDPTCARLLTLDWMKGKEAQRKDIVDRDLPHLVGLLDDRLITRTDLRHLINCSAHRASSILRRYRLSVEAPDERRARERAAAAWREKAVGLYRAKPVGEAPYAFFKRIADEENYPFGWARLMKTLKDAGLLPAQVARRQKKRVSGFAEKSKKKSYGQGKTASLHVIQG